MKRKEKQWMIGDLKRDGDPVLVRHRLNDAQAPDPKHEWLAIVTHHLASVQSNGLPEADYNDLLEALDLSIIDALEKGRGDLVVLVETCHGKRHYYAYVRAFDTVDERVHQLVESNPTHVISYRGAADPERKFIREYMKLLS